MRMNRIKGDVVQRPGTSVFRRLKLPTEWSDPQFRGLLLARCAVWIAGAVTGVAMPLALYQRTGRADLVALLAGLEVTPYLLVGLLAGVLADRTPIRRVALMTCAACGIASAAVPLASMLGLLSTAQFFVCALVAGVSLVFFDASMFAALPALVGRDRLASAFSSLTATSTVIALGAPALGGLLVGVIGPVSTLWADTAMFLVAAGVFRALREPTRDLPAQRASIGRDMRDGLRFIARLRVVRSLTLLGIGNSIAEGVVSGMLVVTVVRLFGMSSDGPYVGFAYSAIAVGAFVGSSLLPVLGRRMAVGSVTVLGLVVAVVGVLGWSQQPSYAIGLMALVIYQGGSTIVILNGVTERSRATPDALQGRVNATARMVAWGGNPIGAYGAAGLVGVLGIAGTQWAAVAVLLVTACLAAVTLRGLERSVTPAPA